MSTKLLAALIIPAALWAQAPSNPFARDPAPGRDTHSGPDAPRGLQEDESPRGAGIPMVPDSPREPARPIAGVVSVRQLQHPVPRKAMQAARDAERFSLEHNSAKAIEKLEQAVRIDPSFKEAQTNLGAQFVHLGRLDEAVPHFQKAYEAGPPDPITCTNLAWAYMHLERYRDAEAMARKALELDPGNPRAEKVLRYASAR